MLKKLKGSRKSCIPGINVIPNGPMIVPAVASNVALTIRLKLVALGLSAMFGLLVRTLLFVAISAIALIAIVGAFIADASIMARERRRRNPTAGTRNPHDVTQSKIVFVEEIAS